MNLKLKPFLKILLIVGIASSALPLTLSCASSATNPTNTNELSQELDKIPNKFQLKEGLTLTAQEFANLFVTTAQGDHLKTFNENVSATEKDGTIITNNALDLTLEGLSSRVDSVSVSESDNTQAEARVTFSHNGVSVARTLVVTNFTKPADTDQILVDEQAAVLRNISPSSNPLTTNVFDRTLKPVVNLLADLDNLVAESPFSDQFTLSEGVETSFFVPDIAADGRLTVSITLTKGKASAIARIFLRGFVSGDQNIVNLERNRLEKLPAPSVIPEVATRGERPEIANLTGLNAIVPSIDNKGYYEIRDEIATEVIETGHINPQGEVQVTLELSRGSAKALAILTLKDFSLPSSQENALFNYFKDLPSGPLRVIENQVNAPENNSIQALSDLVNGVIKTPPLNQMDFNLVITYGKLNAQNGSLSVTIEGRATSPNSKPVFTKVLLLNGFISQEQKDVNLVKNFFATQIMTTESTVSVTDTKNYEDIADFYARTSQNVLTETQLNGVTVTIATNPEQSIEDNTRTLTLVLTKGFLAKTTINVTVSGFLNA